MKAILFVATFTVLAASALLGSVSPAEARSCGAEGQRPCTIFERIPSCNSGLYEDFGKGRCLRKARAGIDCGNQNQRACKIWERVPSCNQNLVEDLSRGVCVAKAVPGRDCGNAGQRPCKVWERIPSCNANLKEDFAKGICVAVNCGKENGRPCTIVERIPSCDAGLVENFLEGRCVKSADAIRHEIAGRKLQQIGGFIASKIAFATQVAANPSIQHALRSKDNATVAGAVNAGALGPTQTPDGELLRTVTVGASAGAKVIIGASAGAGVSIDIKGRRPVYAYATGDWGFSLGFAAEAGMDVGLWVCQNNKIGGDSWGVEFGPADLITVAKVIKGVEGAKISQVFKPGFDVGVALWFDYDNVFQGFTMTPGFGAGADFGGVVKAGTVVEDDPNVNCDGTPRNGSATTVSAPATQHAGPAEITFYQHCDFQGYAVTVPAGQHTLQALRAMGMRNDDVSSIRVGSGAAAAIFEHNHFQGQQQRIFENVSCLVNHNFNDILSSVIVTRR